VRDLDALSSLIEQIEQGQKGTPILLKQYLKMGGGVLGFSVDPQFNDCVDALVLVDLTQTQPKVLARYMGREGARDFLAYHNAGIATRVTRKAS
jgi:hypothetical protein